MSAEPEFPNADHGVYFGGDVVRRLTLERRAPQKPIVVMFSPVTEIVVRSAVVKGEDGNPAHGEQTFRLADVHAADIRPVYDWEWNR